MFKLYELISKENGKVLNHKFDTLLIKHEYLTVLDQNHLNILERNKLNSRRG